MRLPANQLRRLVPERDLACVRSPEHARANYRWQVAASDHMLGRYRAELDVTDWWRDSSAPEWMLIRGRALAALGRKVEVMELLSGMRRTSVDSIALPGLSMATELTVHGHPGLGVVVAESVLARLQLNSDADSGQMSSIA